MQSQRTFTPHGAPIRNAKLLPVQPPGQVIGRKRELGAIHTALKAGQPVLLTGQPGIGKTALAAILATVYSASNPGGVLWFNVVEDDIETLIARVGRAYGVNALTVPGEDWANNGGIVRAVLEKNRPLIVFDGLIDLQATSEFVQRCAARMPVVIANEIPGDGPWTEVRLEALPDSDSEAMFRYYSDLLDSLYKPDIQGLCKFLAGIPLAIELAARQVKVNNLTPAELLTLLPSSGGQDSAYTVMTVVFKRLSPPIQAMLLVLGAAFSGSATAELISDVSKVPVPNIVPLMRQLVGRALAREYVTYGQLAYSTHESVQAYTRQWLDQYQRLQLTENRMLQAVLTYVERHAHSTTADHDRLAAEIANIVGTAVFATATGQANPIHQLIHDLSVNAGDFVTLRGFQSEMVQIRKLSTLFEATTGKRKSQTASQIRSTSQVAQVSEAPSGQDVTRPSDATLGQQVAQVASVTPVTQRAAPIPPPALTQSPKLADTTQVSEPTKPTEEPSRAPVSIIEPPVDAESTPARPYEPVIPNPPIAPADLQAGDETQAVLTTSPVDTAELAKVAQAAAEKAKVAASPEAAPLAERDDIEPEAEPLVAPGPALQETVIAAEPSVVNEPSFAAEATPVLADRADSRSVIETAPIPSESVQAEPVQIVEPPISPEDTETPTPTSLPTVQQRLEEARASGDTHAQAMLFQTLGQYYADQGNRTEALAHYKQALELYETLDDTDGILASLDALATLTAQADDVEGALVYATRGVNLAQNVGERAKLGRLQTRLGDVRLALGDSPAAIEAYTQAAESLRGTENWLAIGMVMAKLGDAYLEQAKPQEATMMLEQALVIFRKERRPDYESRSLGNLGAAATQLQQWPKAQQYHEQALALARANADQEEEAVQLVALAHLHELQNDPAGAALHYRQALHLVYVLADLDSQADYTFELGRLLINDTRTLLQAAQLLRESDGLVPNVEAQRLLSRADKRLERMNAAGIPIPPAEGSNRDYAAAAYASANTAIAGS